MIARICTLLFCLLLVACHTPRVPYCPHISTCPPPCHLKSHCDLFPVLTAHECGTDWGKELKIALAFAREQDFYRAITGFKRALFLLPEEEEVRRLEIEYDILLCYYLGEKYCEALEFFKDSCLQKLVTPRFPVYSDLVIILYDCHRRIGDTTTPPLLFSCLEQHDPCLAERLKISSAICDGELACAANLPGAPTYLHDVNCRFLHESKSINKARALNAILPGAGFWYVGQHNTAITAFLVNTLFIAAAAHFIHHGNIAAGIITLSLEGGWYFGGIYGGGRAAAEYNEQLYQRYGEKILEQERLYPQLMLKWVF